MKTRYIVSIGSIVIAVLLIVSGTVSAQTNSCPLIKSSLLKIGEKNDPADVSRLQGFLNETEGTNIPITGTFDPATEAAVKGFQKKYAYVILKPWNGATKASGVVFMTTIKKINQIACGGELTMSPAELAIIKRYNEKTTHSQSANVSASNQSTVAVETIVPEVVVDSTTSEEDALVIPVDVTAEETDSQIAEASNAPILKRFWGFLVNLFR